VQLEAETGVTRASAILSRDVKGYWEGQGWDAQAIVRTTSRIDVPANGSLLRVGQAFVLSGIAFAETRAITRVEVSTDDGGSWQPADVMPALSELMVLLAVLLDTGPRGTAHAGGASNGRHRRRAEPSGRTQPPSRSRRIPQDTSRGRTLTETAACVHMVLLSPPEPWSVRTRFTWCHKACHRSLHMVSTAEASPVWYPRSVRSRTGTAGTGRSRGSARSR
jgi:hypothetical protein